ncbi:LacI family transcriptional regulator [Pullulanibacillus camelliae]|uniref:LacI family transcriptional regulator n=1 Tax=Pullulanibacillus camelliae TaxID=1707096 RepID=A0A8J2VJB8_9BACL|nr:GntR family transcriptional regulator [Pullulanibacillus camelliae]GGE31882.1 LacI family transcriptional regulator [Pullulanibacillus camelliae]
MNSDKPLYVQIQDYLKKLIMEETLKTNDKIPTEKELMEQFDVSRITVANALSEMAKEGWIKRIPGRGSFVRERRTYQENDMAHMKDQDRNPEAPQFVALIIPSIEDFFAIHIVKGIEEALKRTPYHLTILLSENSKEKEQAIIIQLIEKGVKGLIIFPADAQTYNEEILALKMSKFPFVLIDRRLPGVDTHFVSADSYLGAELAVNYLWELGHRHIAICSDSPLPTLTVSERISGYMEALRQKGTVINPGLILTDFTVDYSRFDEESPLYPFLMNREATAIITLNARLGLYIKALATIMNLRVPEELSILTFDDPIPMYDKIDGFTHINQFEKEMGKRSMEVLLHVIENPQDYQGHYEKIVLEPELVVKHSTASIRKE